MASPFVGVRGSDTSAISQATSKAEEIKEQDQANKIVDQEARKAQMNKKVSNILLQLAG